MDKWLSISQLSEKTGIAETTVRRYTNKYINYFRYEKRSRGKKFHPGAIEILNRISSLYNDEYEAKEIESILATDFPFSIEDERETTTQPPVKSIERQFEEFKEQQGAFNNELLQQVQDQQEYIKKSLKRRDQELLKAIDEMRETRMAIAATKKWWKFWKWGN